ncbi:HemY protein [Neisseria meningitidis]|nr:HemY protein [Neisseria meningitidis]
MKTCLKRIPDSLKNGELSVSVAEKYERLGLYADAVKWVKQHYPHNRRPELLEAFVESVRFLGERDQQKAIDFADAWLKEQPDNALLLMYLGRLAYGRKLWGKAKGYLEASIALKPSISARLVLAKVFDETGEPQKAEAQRNLVLASVAEENRPSAETH